MWIQTAVRRNNDDKHEQMVEILLHVETEMDAGLWSVTDWWEAQSADEDSMAIVTPKFHIVSLTKNGPISDFPIGPPLGGVNPPNLKWTPPRQKN